MESFGTRLRECRKQKGFSQNELAKLLETNHSVIGKYERDDVKPSIDAVRKLAAILETTAAYLIGEADTNELFKDPAMMQRLKDINALPNDDKKGILYALDGLIRSAKLKTI